jgi:hydrogenase/urease accessory protein HupE
MKVYTILFIIITGISFLDKEFYHSLTFVDMIVSIIGIIGLWGYVFKKEWFSPSFWKVYFGFNIVWSIGSLYYMGESFLPENEPTLMYLTLGIGLIILLFMIPYYYALFRYAYRRT